MRFLSLVAATVLLAGCASQPAQPSPVSGTFDDWVDPEGPVWIVTTTGCGFCTGSYDDPEFEGILYFRDGKVLLFQYSLGPGDAMTAATPDAEPYVPIFNDFLQATSIYGQTGDNQRGLRLHAVTTGTLTAAETTETNEVFRDGLADARDATGDANCEDCSATIVQAFGEPRQIKTAFAGDMDAGAGWLRVNAQLEAIGEWLGNAP